MSKPVPTFRRKSSTHEQVQEMFGANLAEVQKSDFFAQTVTKVKQGRRKGQFRKSKSATFTLDGMRYTIGKSIFCHYPLCEPGPHLV